MISIQEYLEQLVNHLGIPEAVVTVDDQTDEYVRVDIQVPPEEAGKMIGNRGETIQAIRQVICASFAEQLKEKKVVVNVNDYAQKKEDEAKAMAHEAAEIAVSEQRPQYLPTYFTPNQRRVAHQELSTVAGIFTHSEGEGRDRCLVIYPESFRAEVMAEAAATPEAVTEPTESTEATAEELINQPESV
jgi:spoIIIJ-associated protein